MSLLEKEVLEALKKGVITSSQYADFRNASVPQNAQPSSSLKPSLNSSLPSSPPTEELFILFFRLMKQHHDLSEEKLLELFHRVTNEDFSHLEQLSQGTSTHSLLHVPVSIFSSHVSPSEALCMFLKNEKKLSFHEIAQELNRDDRSVWTSHRRAVEKSRSITLPSLLSSPIIPVSLFKDRTFSILEHVVAHLKSQRMKNKEIAQLLNKSPAVVATVLLRIKKKQEHAQKQAGAVGIPHD